MIGVCLVCIEGMDTTRYLGSCQLCEGDFKLHGGKLVHHGYKRPGHGEIVGDCPGVAHLPYEVSCELVKSYKARLDASIPVLKARLEDLKTGKVTHLSELKSRLNGSHKLEHYYAGVTEPYLWERTLRNEVSDVIYKIRTTEFESDRCERRIAAWKLMPIRETTEEQVTAAKRAAQAARSEEARKRREEKAAKAAHLKAKRDAKAAKEKAITEEFGDRFRALAETGDKAGAMRVAEELRKKKYSFILLRNLGCDDALIALGLATRDPNSKWVRYHYPLS